MNHNKHTKQCPQEAIDILYPRMLGIECMINILLT